MSTDGPNETGANARLKDMRAVDEAAVLSTLVSALAPLEQPARLRLFRTLCTFFDLPFVEGGGRTGPTHQHSLVEPAASPTPGDGVSPTFSENRAPSPKAFLLEKRPQTDVERVACLAYYLTHYRDQPHFKTLDLSKLNTEAAQIKFSNPARAVDNASGAHFLIQAGQGKKQISAIGEVYVQALPDRAAARQSIAALKRKRSKAKARPSGGEGVVVDESDFENVDDGNE